MKPEGLKEEGLKTTHPTLNHPSPEGWWDFVFLINQKGFELVTNLVNFAKGENKDLFVHDIDSCVKILSKLGYEYQQASSRSEEQSC